MTRPHVLFCGPIVLALLQGCSPPANFDLKDVTVDAAPAPGGWRFAVIGDTRGALGNVNDAAAGAIAAALTGEYVDAVLVTGDLVNGTAAGLQRETPAVAPGHGPDLRRRHQDLPRPR